REHPEKYRTGAKLKNVAVDIDAVLALDEQHAAAQRVFEEQRAAQNKASAEIGKTKDPEARKAAIAQMGELKAKVKEAEERARTLAGQLQPLLLAIPQPPDSDVPQGKDASDN